MNGVMMNVDGNGIKSPKSEDASFPVLVVLGSIGFLGMENGSDGSP